MIFDISDDISYARDHNWLSVSVYMGKKGGGYLEKDGIGRDVGTPKFISKIYRIILHLDIYIYICTHKDGLKLTSLTRTAYGDLGHLCKIFPVLILAVK